MHAGYHLGSLIGNEEAGFLATVKTSKKKPVEDKDSKDRAIAFRAPKEIHGALKQITGRLEMADIKIDGRTPFERDIMIWLVGELWMDGPDKWAPRLNEAFKRFKQINTEKN